MTRSVRSVITFSLSQSYFSVLPLTDDAPTVFLKLFIVILYKTRAHGRPCDLSCLGEENGYE